MLLRLNDAIRTYVDFAPIPIILMDTIPVPISIDTVE